MTYVFSDIHGFWDVYIDFINAVNFSDKDVLYIVGDVIDRGSEGIKILQDVMTRKNVFLIKGNHEYMILPALNELLYSNKFSQNEIIRAELTITPIGQEDTLRDFCKLSRKDQLDIIYYLHSLPLYQNIIVNSQEYLLVHAGLPDFDEVMDMDFYTEEELLFGPHDFSISHFNNTKVIVGHQPTRFISGAEPDEIFKSGDSIGIDCGLGFGGKLGILCLETGEELYL
ncbi:metallophosphoesterase [Clostridium tyrobutyricum]|jgi:serine/threonine protein phosphatase 1|uniref:metallophosphoesterase n=1 Tax=Clostridium tyrobutyricum TaxID=1519 RepID=UPI0018AA55DD|nr:metallophosphoesterase [Clostridium tyrobutyricum]